MARSSRRTAVGTGLVCLDVVQAGDEDVGTFAGGTCGNVLAILAYLRWIAYPVARLAADSASELVEKDLERWGVSLDFLRLEPTANTPVIIERISRTTSGEPVHKFSLRCPSCRGWLPTYRPVTTRSLDDCIDDLPDMDLFFFDRPSPGALLLAAKARAQGATVVFEPTSIGNARHFASAVASSDIVKYSHDQFDDVGVDRVEARPHIEIMTVGEDGLRFRRRTRSGAMGRWHYHEGMPVPALKDVAGAGDWTTALLVDQLVGRADSTSRLTVGQISDALSTAQAAASWSCQFEGPRGGMYVTPRSRFRSEIKGVASASRGSLPKKAGAGGPSAFCPACR